MPSTGNAQIALRPFIRTSEIPAPKRPKLSRFGGGMRIPLTSSSLSNFPRSESTSIASLRTKASLSCVNRSAIPIPSDLLPCSTMSDRRRTWAFLCSSQAIVPTPLDAQTHSELYEGVQRPANRTVYQGPTFVPRSPLFLSRIPIMHSSALRGCAVIVSIVFLFRKSEIISYSILCQVA